MIGSGKGVEACVGFGMHLKDAMDHDVGRQESVESKDEFLRVLDGLFQIEMGIVVSRVDASVGATTSRDADGCTEFEAEAPLYFRLHGGCLWLHLPTAIVGSVVGQMDEISFHVRKDTFFLLKTPIFAAKSQIMRTNLLSNDTIAAVATPPGMGAIAVVRVSGALSHDLVCRLFHQHGEPFAKEKIQGYHTYFGHIVHPVTHEILDEVLVTFFTAPRSFTGEDAAEISVHGSVYIQHRLLELLVEQGVRMAEPGEFTRRAFVNRKFDLAQAEAVADLIASQNQAAHRVAMNQLKGGFSKALQTMRAKLLDLTALMELELDFSEEDVEFADRSQLKSLLSEIQQHVIKLTASFRMGNAIRNGIPVAIIGETNTGKSTLLNALLEDDRAIVSDIAGTTRDTIEEVMNLDGTLFRFIDTAGIRETSETIEKMGIERTYRKIHEAEIVLGMIDATQPSHEILHAAEFILEKIDRKHQTLVLLLNKTDLCPDVSAEYIDQLKNVVCRTDGTIAEHVYIQTLSAKTGNGMEQLRQTLSQIQQSMDIGQDTVLVTNLRHYEALQHAAESLALVQKGLNEGIPTDLVAQDLREALYHLGTITGEITTDEVLGSVFGRFCIGK